ncbi:MAG TPA: hypothetical protein PKA30_06270 [Accumulibacter sp.]|uniref:hypothetical protein n=1 Tax=Accumulibacter sp. TaxID=2053492 RepID=UPI00262278BB|nr:hypothetical protein [Accumulibacter sp.]MDS4056416.1 hypothetical protein [Accumulibacter sp.]HMV05140.1 hypothetical protein [Accumulibacter sp.]HMW79098.1 hypothetical protein [Accumulibacter sp.]HNB69208.1 hypothetical protein [Accumulibacter sp.]HNC27008.1 hypothetical protein [Accumulibacter sp.]
MKVVLITEGNNCALRIEPQDDEGRALLAAFGVGEAFMTKLLPLTQVRCTAVSPQVSPVAQRELAELE